MFIKCDRHTGRHVVISENGKVYIEYYGRARFTTDARGIAQISRGGEVNYQRNGQTLNAREQDGVIRYTFNLGGGNIMGVNDQTRGFLASAVQDMVKHGHNDD